MASPLDVYVDPGGPFHDPLSPSEGKLILPSDMRVFADAIRDADEIISSGFVIPSEYMTESEVAVLYYNKTESDAKYSLIGHNHDATYALRTTTITAGDGLVGGGDLTSSRTLNIGAGAGILVGVDAVSIDTAYTDGRYALKTTAITAGAGLVGGGDLSVNRVIDVGAGEGIIAAADSVAVLFGGTGTAGSAARADHTHASNSTFVFRFSNNTTMADPGSGQFRGNAGTIAATTQIAIDVLSDGGVDVTNVLASLIAEDQLYIQDQANAANWARLRVAALPTNNAGWFLIPVAFLGGGGVPLSNNAPCLIQFTLSSGGGAGGGGYLTQATADPLYINTTGDAMTGPLTIQGKSVAASPDAGNALVWNANGFYAPGADLEYNGEFPAATPYQDGDVVIYNGVAYMCVEPTSDPPTPWSGASSSPGANIPYSASEQWTGRTWLDGKKVYEKTIDVGALPNNSIKNIAHNILNIYRWIDITGAYQQALMALGANSAPPRGLVFGVESENINTSVDAVNIMIRTGTDRTNYTGYVTLRYTCTDR